MNKVELQAKADALADEINFLRALYEAVSRQPSPRWRPPQLPAVRPAVPRGSGHRAQGRTAAKEKVVTTFLTF